MKNIAHSCKHPVGYETLRDAIVVQAVQDWQDAAHCDRERAAKMRNDCESFFCGEWFRLLMGGQDGAYVLRLLREKETTR